MAMTDLYGLDPVAKLVELNGDVHMLAEYLAESLDPEEYVLASVYHGDLYLCKPAGKDSDPYWNVTAQAAEGETGSWDSEMDFASKQFPEGVYLIDLYDDHGMYIVEATEEYE